MTKNMSSLRANKSKSTAIILCNFSVTVVKRYPFPYARKVGNANAAVPQSSLLSVQTEHPKFSRLQARYQTS